MARGMNHVYLVGAVARDPELRFTPSGVPVFELTVAGEDHIIGHDGRERRLPWYHRVSALGKPAEWYSERGLKAGDVVMIEGALEYSSWEDPQGGGKRSAVRVKALRLEGVQSSLEITPDAGGGVRLAGGTNLVVLIGNLVRDPELRYTPGGDAVLGVGLAVNESWRDKSGQQQEKTHWIDATLWRELAEGAANTLHKGDPVMLRGRVMNESWTDKEGNKRSSTKVEVVGFETLTRGEAGAASGGVQRAAQPARPAAAAAAASGGGRGGNRSADLDIDAFPAEEEDLPF